MIVRPSMIHDTRSRAHRPPASSPADCKVVASSCHLWQVIAMKWHDLLTLLDGATLFLGYRQVGHRKGEPIYVASPENALLDRFHLTRGKIARRLLEELRLSSGQLDPAKLQEAAKRTARPRLIRAAARTVRLLWEG